VIRPFSYDNGFKTGGRTTKDGAATMLTDSIQHATDRAAEPIDADKDIECAA